jgi:hypothetical protein
MSENAYGYVKVTDMLKRYDARRVADFVSDTSQRPGGQITNQTQLTALIELLKDDTTLQEALYDASEQVNLAILVGKRYTREQLLDLVLYGLPYNNKTRPEPGGYAIIRLVSDLAFALLVARRGLSAEDTAKLSPRAEEAYKMLAMLRAGERIFDVLDGSNADAGLARHVPVGPADPSNTTNYVTSTARYFGQIPGTNIGG